MNGECVAPRGGCSWVKAAGWEESRNTGPPCLSPEEIKARLTPACRVKLVKLFKVVTATPVSLHPAPACRCQAAGEKATLTGVVQLVLVHFRHFTGIESKSRRRQQPANLGAVASSAAVLAEAHFEARRRYESHPHDHDHHHHLDSLIRGGFLDAILPTSIAIDRTPSSQALPPPQPPRD